MNPTTLSDLAVRATSSGASDDNSDAVPAAIAVAIFVACVLVVLKILQFIRRNRLAAANTDLEPDPPRMWEVTLLRARGPSFKGRWSEIMVKFRCVLYSLQKAHTVHSISHSLRRDVLK